jgi:hypothetical protein
MPQHPSFVSSVKRLSPKLKLLNFFLLSKHLTIYYSNKYDRPSNPHVMLCVS